MKRIVMAVVLALVACGSEPNDEHINPSRWTQFEVYRGPFAAEQRNLVCYGAILIHQSPARALSGDWWCYPYDAATDRRATTALVGTLIGQETDGTAQLVLTGDAEFALTVSCPYGSEGSCVGGATYQGAEMEVHAWAGECFRTWRPGLWPSSPFLPGESCLLP